MPLTARSSWSRRQVLLWAAVLATLGSAEASAAPQGGVVRAGQGTLTTIGSRTEIQQLTERLAMDFQRFDIAAHESVNIDQPNVHAVFLGRVVSGPASSIMGSLTANGQVYLINPRGIVFGQGARIDTASLVASSLDLDPDDFMHGQFALELSADAAGEIVNRGEISVGDGGSVALIGGSVRNEGLIVAHLGQVTLAAADRAVLRLEPDGLLGVEVTEGVAEALGGAAVANLGRIVADGGRVVLSARAMNDVLDTVVSNTGVVAARSIVERQGRVFLVGEGGDVRSSGSIDVSGAGVEGGAVRITGDRVAVTGRIAADGDLGGGTVQIGGERQGGGELARADRTFIGAGAEISADALTVGDGGEVIVFADEFARVQGHISARGGPGGGDGGFIETSGLENLHIELAPDAGAPAGAAGQWLIDPSDITIVQSGANGNFDGTGTLVDPFIPNSASAEIDVAVVRAGLDAADVLIDARNSPDDGESGQITLDAAATLDYDGLPAARTLTLRSAGDIHIDGTVIDGDGATADVLDLILDTTGDDVLIGTGASIAVNDVIIDAANVFMDATATLTAVDLDLRQIDDSASNRVELDGLTTLTSITTENNDTYTIRLAGDGSSVADPVTLRNSADGDALEIGDEAGDTITFTAGLTLTRDLNLIGTLATAGGVLSLDDVDIDGAAVIDTTAGGAAPGGADIDMPGDTIRLNDTSATLIAGTAGSIAVNDVTNAGGSGNGVLDIVSASGVTIDSGADADNLILRAAITGQVLLQNTVDLGALTVEPGGFSVRIEDPGGGGDAGTIDGVTNFRNTGAVTLGDGNDTITFTGGLVNNNSRTVATNEVTTSGDLSLLIVDGAPALTLAGGTATIGMTVGGAPTFPGDGTQISGGTFATGGDPVAIDAGGGTITLAGDVTVDTGSGADIDITSDLTDAGNAFDLSLLAGTGTVTLDAALTLGGLRIDAASSNDGSGGALAVASLALEGGTHVLDAVATHDVDTLAASAAGITLTDVDALTLDAVTVNGATLSSFAVGSGGASISAGGALDLDNGVDYDGAGAAVLEFASSGDLTVASAIADSDPASVDDVDLSLSGVNVSITAAVNVPDLLITATTGADDGADGQGLLGVANLALDGGGAFTFDNTPAHQIGTLAGNVASLTLNESDGLALDSRTIAGTTVTGLTVAGVATLTAGGDLNAVAAVSSGDLDLSGVAGNVAFAGNLSTAELTPNSGAFAFAATGASTTIANTTAVTFTNTGGVTLGDGGDAISFQSGLTHHTSVTTIGGTLSTTSGDISLLAVDGAGSTIDTSAGGNNVAIGMRIGALPAVNTGAGTFTQGGNFASGDSPVVIGGSGPATLLGAGLTIDAGTSTIVIDSAVTDAGGGLTLGLSGADVSDGAGGAITVDTLSLAGGGSFVLDGDDDDVRVLTATGTDLVFRDSNDLSVGALGVSGPVSVSSGGALALDGAFDFDGIGTGTWAFTADAGGLTVNNAITDGNATGDDLNLDLTASGATVAVTAAASADLAAGDLTVSGTNFTSAAGSSLAGDILDVSAVSASVDLNGAIDFNDILTGGNAAISIDGNGSIINNAFTVSGSGNFTVGAGGGTVTFAGGFTNHTGVTVIEGTLATAGAPVSLLAVDGALGTIDTGSGSTATIGMRIGTLPALSLNTTLVTGGTFASANNDVSIDGSGPATLLGNVVSDAGTGTITLSSAVTDGLAAFSLGLTGASVTDTAGGAITVDTLNLSGGGFSLATAGHDVAALSASGTTLAFNDQGNLSLTGLAVTGTADVAATGTLSVDANIDYDGSSPTWRFSGDTGVILNGSITDSVADADALALRLTSLGTITIDDALQASQVLVNGPIATDGTSGALTVAELALLGTSGDFTFDNAGHDVGTLAVKGTSLVFVDTNALTVGSVTIDGTTVTGIDYDGGNGNVFSLTGTSLAIDAAVSDSVGATADAITLALNSAGTVTDGAAGAITVGTLSLDGGGSFVLDGGDDDAATLAVNSAADVTFTDVNAISFGAFNAGNSADITAGADLTLPAIAFPGSGGTFRFATTAGGILALATIDDGASGRADFALVLDPATTMLLGGTLRVRDLLIDATSSSEPLFASRLDVANLALTGNTGSASFVLGIHTVDNLAAELATLDFRGSGDLSIRDLTIAGTAVSALRVTDTAVVTASGTLSVDSVLDHDGSSPTWTLSGTSALDVNAGVMDSVDDADALALTLTSNGTVGVNAVVQANQVAITAPAANDGAAGAIVANELALRRSGATGAFTFDNAGVHDVGTLAATATALTFADSNALTIGVTSIGGALSGIDYDGGDGGLFALGATSLTIDQPIQDGDTVTFADAVTVTLTGSADINAAVNASDLLIDGGADATGGSVTAAELALTGGGAFDFSAGAHDVGTLAGDVSSLSFTDNDDLTIGNVLIEAAGNQAVNGLAANGTVDIAGGPASTLTLSGDVDYNGADGQSLTFTAGGTLSLTGRVFDVDPAAAPDDRVTVNLNAGTGFAFLAGSVNADTLAITAPLLIDSPAASLTLTNLVLAGGGTGTFALDDAGASYAVGTLSANLTNALILNNDAALILDDVSASSVTLTASAVTQNGGTGVSAGALTLLGGGAGDFVLGGGNDVDTLSATLSGGLTFIDVDDLALATLDAGGDIDITSGLDLSVPAFDFNGRGVRTYRFASSGGNVNVDGAIADSVPGDADRLTLVLNADATANLNQPVAVHDLLIIAGDANQTATGTITEPTEASVTRLGLRHNGNGGGSFALNQAGNDVDVLAAETGALNFTDADDLSIAALTIDGVALGALNANGGVDIASSGNLLVTGFDYDGTGTRSYLLRSTGADVSVTGAVADAVPGGDVLSLELRAAANAALLAPIAVDTLIVDAASATSGAAADVVISALDLRGGGGAFDLSAGSFDTSTLTANLSGDLDYVDQTGVTLGGLSAANITLSAATASQSAGQIVTTGVLDLQGGGGGAFMLTEANQVGTLTGNLTGDLQFTAADSIVVGDLGTAGFDLTATSASQLAGSVLSSGAVSFAGGAGGAFVFSEGGNDVASLAAALSGDLTFTDSNTLLLGDVTAANAILTATGLTQTAGTALNTAALTLGGGPGLFDLSEPANSVVSLSAALAGDLSLVDTGALTLGNVAAGATSLEAGSLGQTPGTALTASALSLRGGAGGDFVLTEGNDVVSLDASLGNALQYTDVSGVTLGPVAASNVTLTAAAATQTPATGVTTGTLSLNGGGGGAFVLDGTNDVVNLTANLSGALTFTDVDAVVLDDVGSGDFSLTARGASQSPGSAIVAAALSLAGGQDADFSLTAAGNDLVSVSAALAGGLQLTDQNDLRIDDISAASVTLSASTLTQGAGTGVSAAALDLAGGAANLDQANDVDTIGAVLSGDLTFRDSDDLALRAISAANVTLDAGSLTQSVGMAVSTGTLALSGGAAGAFDLGNTNDVDVLAASLSGDLVFADSDAFELADSTVAGTAALTAVTLNSVAALTIGTLDVSGIAGSTNLSGNTNLGALLTGSGAGAVNLSGVVTVTAATDFANTGGVGLGSAASDTLTFGAGLTSTASPTAVAGSVQATSGGLSFAALAVSADVTLMTSDADVAAGAVSGSGSERLTITTGSGAVTLASVAALDRLVVNGAGLASGDVSAATLDVSAVSGVTDIAGAVALDSLVTGGAGSVALRGGGAVTGAVTFANTGGVTLGDDAADALNFAGGVTSTASSTDLAGMIGADGPLVIGSAVVRADTRIDVTAGDATLGATSGSGAESLTVAASGSVDVGPLSGFASLDLGAGSVNVASIGATSTASFSGGTTLVSGTVDVATLDTSAVTASASFNGLVTVDDLVAPAGMADLAFNAGGTFSNAATIGSSGNLVLDGNTQPISFNAGLTRTVGSTITRGAIASTGDLVLGEVSLGLDTSLIVAGGGLTTGAVSGTGQTLNVVAPGQAVVLASVAGVGTLNVDARALDVTGPAGASSIDVMDVTDRASFAGRVDATDLTPVMGTASINLSGGARITNAVSFDNTGGVTLDGRVQTAQFLGGLTSTASLTALAGSIDSSGSGILLGTADLLAPTSLSGATLAVTGAIGGGALDIAGITGSADFLAPVDLTALSTGANGQSVSLAGGTVTAPVTFNGSGGVQLDGGATPITFEGGVTSTAATTVVSGEVRTAGSPLTLGATTAPDATVLQTAGGDLTIGSLAGSDSALVLDAGSGNVQSGALTAISDITADAVSLTISGIEASGAADLSAGTIRVTGDSTILGGVRFDGELFLGGDVVTDTAPIQVTAGNGLTLTGDALLDTTAGGGNGAPGADILIERVAGGGFDLALDAGGAELRIPDVSNAGSVTLARAGLATFEDIAATGAIDLSAADLAIGSSVTSSGGDVRLDAPLTLTGAALGITTGGGRLDVTGPIQGNSVLSIDTGTGGVTIAGDIGSMPAPLVSLDVSGGQVELAGAFVDGDVEFNVSDVRFMTLIGGAAVDVTGQLSVAGDVLLRAGQADIETVVGSAGNADAFTLRTTASISVPEVGGGLEALTLVSSAGLIDVDNPVELGGGGLLAVSDGDFLLNSDLLQSAGNVEIFSGGAFLQNARSVLASDGFVRIAAVAGMQIGTIDAQDIFLTLTGNGSSFQRAKVSIDLSNDLIADGSVIFASSVPVDVGSQTNTFGIRAQDSAFLVGGQVFQPRSNAIVRSALSQSELQFISDTSSASPFVIPDSAIAALIASIPNAAQLGAGRQVASTGQLALASAQASQTQSDEEIAQITDEAFQDRDPYSYNEENSIGLPEDQDEFVDVRGALPQPLAALLDWLRGALGGSSPAPAHAHHGNEQAAATADEELIGSADG